MSELKRGDKVRVVGNYGYGRSDATHLPLMGQVGTVTGRGLDEFIEVNVPVESTGKVYGFLLLPSEVEKLVKEGEQ